MRTVLSEVAQVEKGKKRQHSGLPQPAVFFRGAMTLTPRQAFTRPGLPRRSPLKWNKTMNDKRILLALIMFVCGFFVFRSFHDVLKSHASTKNAAASNQNQHADALPAPGPSSVQTPLVHASFRPLNFALLRGGFSSVNEFFGRIRAIGSDPTGTAPTATLQPLPRTSPRSAPFARRQDRMGQKPCSSKGECHDFLRQDGSPPAAAISLASPPCNPAKTFRPRSSKLPQSRRGAAYPRSGRCSHFCGSRRRRCRTHGCGKVAPFLFRSAVLHPARRRSQHSAVNDHWSRHSSVGSAATSVRPHLWR
jgi:hypothetical protein